MLVVYFVYGYKIYASKIFNKCRKIVAMSKLYIAGVSSFGTFKCWKILFYQWTC